MKEENQLSVEVAEADETRRMLNRWTLELANWLMSEVALTLVKEMKVIDEVALTSVKEMKK